MICECAEIEILEIMNEAGRKSAPTPLLKLIYESALLAVIHSTSVEQITHAVKLTHFAVAERRFLTQHVNQRLHLSGSKSGKCATGI